MSTHSLHSRPFTEEAHTRAIERAVQHIRANLEESLDLDHLARVAFISKFHFLRVFEAITGTTPHNFVACCRLERAKELLLNSTKSITEICMEVGYSSLGSFSKTFSLLVGASPSEFREFSRRLRRFHVEKAINKFMERRSPEGSEQIHGIVEAPPNAEGFIFIGAFDRGAPQGPPDSPTILLRPGPFSIERLKKPVSHLLAAMIPFSADLSSLVLACPVALVASQRLISGEAFTRPLLLELRPLKVTDPPVVVTLPLLLAQVSGQLQIPARRSERLT
jgi:AraC family transcriptional regulator